MCNSLNGLSVGNCEREYKSLHLRFASGLEQSKQPEEHDQVKNDEGQAVDVSQCPTEKEIYLVDCEKAHGRVR